MSTIQPKTKLTPRERLITALEHKEPDYVPIDLGSTGGGITDVAYFSLKEHLGLEGDEGTVIAAGLTVSEFDERVLRRLDVDVRHVGLRGPNRRPSKTVNPDGSWTDEWGLVYRKEGFYPQIVGSPLRGASRAEIERHDWPDPADPGRVEGLSERAKHLYENTDYALSARSVSGGIFLLTCRLRSMDQFLMDMMLDKPLAKALLTRVQDTVIGLFDVLLDTVGSHVQMVETQDDLGEQRAPLISPALYCELVQPCHARLAEFIKKKTNGRAKVFMHSDGSIYDLIPHIIDAGIEVLNPIQPQAAKMEPWRLKTSFGDRLSFHGGLDQQHTLPFGSVDDVREEVRQKIGALAPGGGYVFAPCHNLQPDVPPANIVAMFEAAREFGRYPLA